MFYCETRYPTSAKPYPAIVHEGMPAPDLKRTFSGSRSFVTRIEPITAEQAKLGLSELYRHFNMAAIAAE